jgi:hypothetical protein
VRSIEGPVDRQIRSQIEPYILQYISILMSESGDTSINKGNKCDWRFSLTD